MVRAQQTERFAAWWQSGVNQPVNAYPFCTGC
jgi:hypothetical protein